MKKIISLIIVMAFAVSVLGGCKASIPKNPSQDATSTEAPSETGSTDTGSSDTGAKETFKIATVRWTDSWPTDYLESGVMKQLEENLNVDIEWQVYYYSDWAEQKSLLLASGDLPDAFFGSITLQETDIAQNRSSFVDLTDLIPQNMPNLAKVFEEDPTLKALATNSEGRIYSLVKKLPLRPVAQEVMYINQKWLDKLGLSVPTTYTELEQTLKAFATQDVDGDGDNSNQYGYTNKASLLNDLRQLLSPFGTLISRSGNYMGLNAAGEPVFMPVEDNYKEAVKWANKLYKEGALDPERFTQDDSMVTAKTQATTGAQVGIVYAWTADAQVGVNAKDFTLVPAIAGPDGERYVDYDPTFLDMANRELVITNQCKNPELLLKWADQFYTDEVSLQTYYGSIPDQIKKNDDGTYEVLVPTDGSSLDTSAWSNSFRDFGPKYMTKDFQSKVILPKDQGDGVKLAQDAVNAPYVKNTAFPTVSYTDEQLQSITALSTDIYKYVETQYAHWVVDGGIDAEWDDYIKTLDTMGLQDLLKIHRDAYNVYLETINK